MLAGCYWSHINSDYIDLNQIEVISLMPIEINGQTFYSTAETCTKIGISPATLTRWLRKGVLKEFRKDRRGWRLFNDLDIDELQSEATRIEVNRRFESA